MLTLGSDFMSDERNDNANAGEESKAQIIEGFEMKWSLLRKTMSRFASLEAVRTATDLFT